MFDLTCFEQLDESANCEAFESFSHVTGIRPISQSSVPYVEFPPDQRYKGAARKIIIKGNGTEFWNGYHETGGFVDTNVMPREEQNYELSTSIDTIPQFERTMLSLPENGIIFLSTPPLRSFLTEEECSRLARECCAIKRTSEEHEDYNTSISAHIQSFLNNTEISPRIRHRLQQDLALTFIVL
jgi:hypothetical protein